MLVLVTRMTASGFLDLRVRVSTDTLRRPCQVTARMTSPPGVESSGSHARSGGAETFRLTREVGHHEGHRGVARPAILASRMAAGSAGTTAPAEGS